MGTFVLNDRVAVLMQAVTQVRAAACTPSCGPLQAPWMQTPRADSAALGLRQPPGPHHWVTARYPAPTILPLAALFTCSWITSCFKTMKFISVG